MKRHLQFPDGIKYTKTALPPSWARTWSPKRERKAARRTLESQARQFEHMVEDAIKRGQQKVANQFAEFAAKARAAANALFGLGASFRKNRALRRTV